MTAHIGDQALITAAHPSTASRRKYHAIYSNGNEVTFAVGHAEAARVYAREYGERFLGGARVVTVKWLR